MIQSSTNSERHLSRFLPILALAVMVAMVVGCAGSEPEPFTGYSRLPIPDVSSVSLPSVEADGSQTPFQFVAPEDGLLVVYFGYTTCPDFCPTTMADTRRALGEMGDEADRVQVAMVTIDPEVDTAELLTGYVRSFVPSAVALRTTDDDVLRSAAFKFGVDYGKSEVDGGEEVYHTTALYGIDDNGELVMTWPFGTSPDALRSDIERLLNGDRA